MVMSCFHQISYLVFLGLYSYILVVKLSSNFHFIEGILIIWVFTIFVEELRQVRVTYVVNNAHVLAVERLFLQQV